MVEDRQTGRRYSSSGRIRNWIIGTFDSCHVIRGSTGNNNLPVIEHPKPLVKAIKTTKESTNNNLKDSKPTIE